MTETMGGKVPQDLPPDSDTDTEADEVVDQIADETSTHQDEPPAGLFDDINQANTEDVNTDDSGEVSDDADQATDESDDTDEASDNTEGTDEAPVGLVTDQATDESDDTDEADQATDESDDTDEASDNTEDTEDSDDSDESDESDDGVAPGSTVFVDTESPADSFDDSTAADHVSLAGRIKAAVSRLNFGSRRTRVIIIGLVALAALIAAMVVISSSTDDGDSNDVVTPAVTVDDVFSGLCETVGEVDLTTMPVAGFSLDGLNTDGTDDAATVQSRVVDDYFVDTSLGCSPQGIEFLRTGVDQARIDADRPGLDTRDSAGRIAYNSDNPAEALVVAEYLNKVMSECAAEMVVLSEADIQDGLYVLTFTDGSYGDLIWVKMPVETALSGVDSIEVMSCMIGLVEGSDGLTRSFMYSEGLGTFVSVETPFGNTVEYVPAPVEETGAEPVTVTDEPEAPEVTSDQATAADDTATEVEEPVQTPDAEVEQAEEPATTPESEQTPVADPPKADPPKADPPKADPPKADEPKADPPKADPPKADPPKADPPKADPPKADPPKANEPVDTADETTEVKPDIPADDAPAETPAGPVDAGDGGTIPSTSGDGGCNGTCGGPNEDGSSGGTIPGDGGGGGCVGICVGQGGNDGSQGGCVSDCPGNGGSQGGCNVDCNGGDEPEDIPEPEDTPEEDPEEVPEEDPQDDECLPPNTFDAFGNCKAPPRAGAVDL